MVYNDYRQRKGDKMMRASCSTAHRTRNDSRKTHFAAAKPVESCPRTDRKSPCTSPPFRLSRFPRHAAKTSANLWKGVKKRKAGTDYLRNLKRRAGIFIFCCCPRLFMIEKYILKHLRQKIYLPFMMNN